LVENKLEFSKSKDDEEGKQDDEEEKQEEEEEDNKSKGVELVNVIDSLDSESEKTNVDWKEFLHFRSVLYNQSLFNNHIL